mmetsp:Transcript_15184/g.45785  ORF Transcript_15184/g.45785 Transcript_15184/m.45785 type:complete len:488 (-) Transcript_15184:397-1860(-)
MRHQLPRHRLPIERIEHVGILDLPDARLDGIAIALSLQLGAQLGLCGAEAHTVRVCRPVGHALAVHLDELEVGAPQGVVHGHVHAHVEEVLVDLGIEVGCHQHAIVGLGAFALRQAVGGQDARQLHLVLDAAVLVEVPEEPVLIVGNGGEEADDETAGTAGLHVVRAVLRVLPQDAVILLVHADSLLDHHRLSLGVGEHAVEVFDGAQAVAPQLQAVGRHPQPVVHRVKGTLPVEGRPGVAIRHDDLRGGGAVNDRPNASLILIPDMMQHQALAVVEGDAQIPLLPPHAVALQCPGGPLRLHHVQRLGGLTPGLGHEFPVVIAVQQRHLVRLAALHPDVGHLLGVHVQIDHHVERVGVEVVVGQPGGTCVQEALHEPPIQRLPFLSEAATVIPRVAGHLGHIGDAVALPDEALHLGIRLEDVLRLHTVLYRHHRLHRLHLAPGDHLSRVDRMQNHVRLEHVPASRFWYLNDAEGHAGRRGAAMLVGY